LINKQRERRPSYQICTPISGWLESGMLEKLLPNANNLIAADAALHEWWGITISACGAGFNMNLSDMQHRQPLIFSDQLPEISPDLAMISPGGLRSMRLTSAGSEPSMNAWFGGRRTSDLI
jgi:hypothetical protein